MICSISGEIPKEPVVSPKSGAIFEKKHAVNYISTSGKDPINDEPLEVSDLIPINSSSLSITPPNPPSSHSIPSLLSTFQNEWDALALEVFTLRKQLHAVKEELSASLYHYDAAVRVAAKAIKERDVAQQALLELAASIGSGELKNENTIPSTNGVTIPAEEINIAREELFKMHKEQKAVLSIDPEAQVLITFSRNLIQPFKKLTTAFLNPEIKTLLIGSPTGSTAIYTFDDSKVQKFSHKGLVTALNFIEYDGELLPFIAHKDVLIVGDGKFTYETEQKDILLVLTHPRLTELFIILSHDRWSLNHIKKGAVYVSSAISEGISAGDIHVDGALLGIGNKTGVITIFNLATAEAVFKLNTKYFNIQKLKFALNGYWLFVSSSNDNDESCLEVIDLRKNIVVHTIEFKAELIDFTIDPSTSILVTCTAKTFHLHRYVKKGKRWLDNHSTSPLEGSKSLIRTLGVLTSATDSDFINDQVVKFVAVTENSTVLEYQLSYS
ncbi:uncharacterized protein PRCAT00004630001 [Priceomyces carsonii]|uniref:uncharacterized protein n=1 Tax=Priceomyces carsonii TaxID=28549 RepID=UPI002EDA3B6F|nr:unnamed protein product [Priceomyces carsonii]